MMHCDHDTMTPLLLSVRQVSFQKSNIHGLYDTYDAYDTFPGQTGREWDRPEKGAEAGGGDLSHSFPPNLYKRCHRRHRCHEAISDRGFSDDTCPDRNDTLLPSTVSPRADIPCSLVNRLSQKGTGLAKHTHHLRVGAEDIGEFPLVRICTSNLYASHATARAVRGPSYSGGARHA